MGINPLKRLTQRGLHLQVHHQDNITRRPGPATGQAAEVLTEIVTQALLRVHQATAVLRAVVLRAVVLRAVVLRAVVLRAVVLRAVVLRAVVLATEGTVDHQAVDHQAVDHQAVDHQAVDHQAVGRVVTVVPPAEVHQQEMLARARLLLTAQGTALRLVMVVAERDLPE